MIGLMPGIIGDNRPPPSVTLLGRAATSGDGFPAGNFTFTAGLKLIVVCCELAGSPQASNVRVGGVLMTQAAQTGVLNGRSASIWYLETTASGVLSVTGTGGTGRSALDVYEVTGYTSAVPILTAVNTNSGSPSNSLPIVLDTPTNALVLGAGVGPFTGISVSADRGDAPTVVTAAYESATSHFSWRQRPTRRGPTSYLASGGVVGGINLAAAAWR